MRTSKIAVVIFLTMLVVGCKDTTQLGEIGLGQSKQEVISCLGQPDAFRGSVVNEKGQRVEILEYTYCRNGTFLGIDNTFNYDYYWLYFINNNLVQWGKAGDWQAAPNQTIRIENR